MPARFFHVVIILVVAGVRALAEPDTHAAYGASLHATGERGIVATSHPLATQAGIAAMEQGGNAVDAAIAAGFMLAVVDNFNSGIGGGCFILIRKPDGTLVAIDGRETAPAATTRDMFIRDGNAVPELSRTGALAVGVSGAVAAYAKAVSEHGKLSLADAIAPAATVADEGFLVHRTYASRIASVGDDLKQFPGSRAIFFNEDGNPVGVGEMLHQKDLAGTLLEIATNGTDAFYRGEFAEKVASWMAANGGLLTKHDFADYKAKEREPVMTTYRGNTVAGFPPPSSGGVHVAQILNILENFDLAAMNPTDRTHVIAEAMKLAFADRAHWLGDADFAPVPRGLIDKGYAKDLSRRIFLNIASEVPSHGLPPNADGDLFNRKHTTHFCAADADGTWVAITATVNTTFGSKVVVPGTGVVLNNEMDDFSAQPGAPNAFGLIGAEANSVAPGKRPLSSMSPTIVMNAGGKPIFSIGAAGGPTIISQAVLGIINRIDLDLPLKQCLSSPRFHHQWRPDALQIESSLAPEIQAELKRRGHVLRSAGDIGVTQTISRDPNGGFEGMAEPRGIGSAGGR
jgi:gamma-glutamyltranspeptidase / glutathione hydrolase